MEVCYSETGRKLPAHVPDECHMVFVCDEFSGPDYERLVEKKFKYALYYYVHVLLLSESW